MVEDTLAEAQSMAKNLQDNGIPDESGEFEQLRIDDDYYFPVLHLYYNNLHFVTKERDEQYGTVDFVANIGGLLGLCMGLSTISLMEIIYFFTARFYYNLTTARHEDI